MTMRTRQPLTMRALKRMEPLVETIVKLERSHDTNQRAL